MAILEMSIFSLCALLLTVMQHVHGCSVYEYGVSQKERDIIVNKHNELREQIANGTVPGQPRGINLKRMVWDDYLADEAQNVANTCIFDHKEVNDSRWVVGQNLLQQPTYEIEKGTDWNGAIQFWFDEYTQYNYTTHYVFDENTGHYTQVVWADTAYVGCGYTYYPDGSGHSKLYVCNYGPSGNVFDETVYIVGDHGCENLCR